VAQAPDRGLKHFRAEARQRPWRDSGFGFSARSALCDPAALNRISGLPTASRPRPVFPWHSQGGLGAAARANNRVLSSRSWLSASSDADCWSRWAQSCVCRAGPRAREIGRGRPPDHPLGIANSDGWRAKPGSPPTLQDPARTIFLRYPPAELNFIAKIFRKNPPRCRIRWKLIAADIWGCCSIFECWKMTNRCDEFATMNQCLQPLG
jgi:hypothetical protein